MLRNLVCRYVSSVAVIPTLCLCIFISFAFLHGLLVTYLVIIIIIIIIRGLIFDSVCK